MIAALMVGCGLGFVTGAQVGPIWLLCARSVLRRGFAVGLAIGSGAALIDLIYAALGETGADQVLRIASLRLVFGIAGAAVLIYLGLKSFRAAFQARAGLETMDEVATPARAFRTSLAATASNPLTIASWAAIFTATSTARLASHPIGIVVGAGLGSFAWFLTLSSMTALVRHRISERGLRWADALSGLSLMGFGAFLGLKSIEGH